MIRVVDNSRDYGINARIAEDPRFSQAQREAIQAAVGRDRDALFVGLDKQLRPTLRAKLSGPRKHVEYALARNGEPKTAERPFQEIWS